MSLYENLNEGMKKADKKTEESEFSKILRRLQKSVLSEEKDADPLDSDFLKDAFEVPAESISPSPSISINHATGSISAHGGNGAGGTGGTGGNGPAFHHVIFDEVQEVTPVGETTPEIDPNDELTQIFIRAQIHGRWGSFSLRQLLGFGTEGTNAIVGWFSQWVLSKAGFPQEKQDGLTEFHAKKMVAFLEQIGITIHRIKVEKEDSPE